MLLGILASFLPLFATYRCLGMCIHYLVTGSIAFLDDYNTTLHYCCPPKLLGWPVLLRFPYVVSPKLITHKTRIKTSLNLLEDGFEPCSCLLPSICCHKVLTHGSNTATVWTSGALPQKSAFTLMPFWQIEMVFLEVVERQDSFGQTIPRSCGARFSYVLHGGCAISSIDLKVAHSTPIISRIPSPIALLTTFFVCWSSC